MNLEINKIFNMDCLECMKTLPDKCVDLIIADPPYNRNVATWDNIKEDRYIELLVELARESKRILKDDGSIFIYNQQPMASLMFNIFYKELVYIDEIVWYYKNGGGNPKNKCKNAHQLLYWFSKNKKYKCNIDAIRQPYSGTRAIYKGNIDKNPKKAWTPNEKGALPTNVWEISIVRQKEATELAKISVQKPIEICDRIIKVASNQNDLVYIPFAGSGSEIESCIRNNRNYIATELNDEYIKNIIMPRLNNINI